MKRPRLLIITASATALLVVAGALYAQGGTPFGGVIQRVTPCECNGVYWLTINNVARQQSPKLFIYSPMSTILYEFKQIQRPGPQTLGLWSGEQHCVRPVCDGDCCSVGTGKLIKMVGTSR